MSEKNLTTTNIGVEEQKHLKKLAAHHKLKQVEFINASISYFKKTGINPAEEIFSPREEIEKLTKRVNEVIRFLQVHEKQKLAPLLERLLLLERKLSDAYTNVISKNDLEPLKSMLNQVGHLISKNNTLLSDQSDYLRQDHKDIYQMQKNTIALIGLLYELFKNRSTTRGFREDDKTRFENALSKIR